MSNIPSKRMLKKCVGANNLKGSPKAIQFVY
jgi:hypothetical protein